MLRQVSFVAADGFRVPSLRPVRLGEAQKRVRVRRDELQRGLEAGRGRGVAGEIEIAQAPPGEGRDVLRIVGRDPPVELERARVAPARPEPFGLGEERLRAARPRRRLGRRIRRGNVRRSRCGQSAAEAATGVTCVGSDSEEAGTLAGEATAVPRLRSAAKAASLRSG